ncbi:hypothetical protein HG535_0H01350 [Zygotorulaspora mrakii]|uniref:Uncharacterized protein n=1 Tax=Zygotorulaspora mrakii TaxID=42260 RepID=A0A7H9B7T1_ZYGMR|nr:uncharacterized protein HG535_0H01350 [Zygotorulaspora mrakii]QLG74808.1 hypothetical protein HG535_0H01350 [Zygotorulaspora mrakii]
MTSFQRRPSLLFNNYENAITARGEEEQAQSILVDGKLNIGTDPNKMSVDDMDMISLSTSFDRQMLLGSPMYLETVENGEQKSMVLEDYSTHESHCSKPIPSDASNLNLVDICGNENPFESIANLRIKYILASSQDSGSNAKNDIEKWFLYPKPLPKFWKFAYDKRLQSPESADSDEEINLKERQREGYYCPTNQEDQYIEKDDSGPSSKIFGKVHYTGEFFELDHYITKFEQHIRQFSSYPSSCNYNVIPSFEEFREDFHFIVKTLQRPTVSEMAQRRMDYLKNKFELFQLLNSKAEILENKRVPLRDFYNARKVDRDLLLSGFVTQRQLSEFIWEKLNFEPHRVVYRSDDGDAFTLIQIFEKSCSPTEPLDIGLKIINDEFLEWYKDVYLTGAHVFPTKNAVKTLRGKELRFHLLAITFLETDNYIDGEYLAEIFIKHCVHMLEKSKYQLCQVSIDFQFYGEGETSWWIKFAHWIIRWKIISYNVRWNVRISRCYSKLISCGRIKNFQEYLNLIFEPLFKNEKVTNIELQFFLSNVCCMDLVVSQSDDYIWKSFSSIDTEPVEWASGDNPTISYYMYHIYSALSQLNGIRHCKYLNTLSLRNYCSPLTNRTSQFDPSLNFTDQVESLVCNLLLCEAGIVQAEPLWHSPPMLTYLFYLCQIPMIVAPLSSVSAIAVQNYQSDVWAKLRHELPSTTRDITEREESTYVKNPFMDLFKVGMKVSLSSSSVLFNSSYTGEPILEEYSVAASIYLLNAADLCEFSRTSVLCSGYEGFYKAHWIGVSVSSSPYFREEVGLVDTWYDKEKDTSARHNVPSIRRIYRMETFNQEWNFIKEQFQLK